MHRALLSLLLLFGLPGLAHGQTEPSPCEAFLDALGEAPRSELYQSDGASLTLAGAGRSGDEAMQRFVKRSKSGRELAFERHFTCDDGMLAMTSSTSLDPVEPTERYSPGLIWLAWPLEKGTSWSYSGTYTTEVYGTSSKLPARASGRILGVERIETAEGELSAVHVELELKISEGDERVEQTIERWIVLQPALREARWRIVDADYGSSDFRLVTPPAPAAADTPQIIILKGPVEKL